MNQNIAKDKESKKKYDSTKIIRKLIMAAVVLGYLFIRTYLGN